MPMIEAKYLDQAIAQNLGDEHPDAMTCLRLAAQLIDRILLFGMPDYISKSGAAALGYALGAAPIPSAQIQAATPSAFSLADAQPVPPEEIVDFPSKSEFAREIDGKRAADIWPIMDEIMSIFATYHPDLYNRAMQILKTK